ncbi:MAG: hypothetical protein IFK94_13435 [Acidobacteria bacterium]|uniref:Uncharacterized protein n=1 Tax=Candidatus Polarisedimenticola svalbardensis TaxID=2886004 RepID=A0A8J7CF81_9BACT|nr:hypothetical protein [Candidatus Polarisedimenticola svalbardensis]
MLFHSSPAAQDFWCEGLDDNGDGEIDDGCIRSCPDPYLERTPASLSADTVNPTDWTTIRHGSGLLSVYSDDRSGAARVFSLMTALSGAQDFPEQVLGDGIQSAINPAATWSGTGFGVVWTDYREGNAEVYFRDLDNTGTPTSYGIERAVSSSNGDSLNPSVIWSGTEYLVAWDDLKGPNRDIYIRRLDPNGDPLGSVTRVTSDSSIQVEPVLAWDGSQYLVAWIDHRNGNTSVFAARLNQAGSVIGNEIQISNAAGSSTDVSVSAAAPGKFSLAWVDNRNGPMEIWTSPLTSPSYLPSESAITSGGDAAAPSLTSSGEEFFIAWEDHRLSSPGTYLVRIDLDGAPLSPEVRLTSNGTDTSPSVVWHGSGNAITYINNTGSTPYLLLSGCCHADFDLDGYRACEGDCSLEDEAVYPSATESCSGVDDDCDGEMDEGCPGTCAAHTPSIPQEVYPSPTGGIQTRMVWNGNGYGVSWTEYISGVPSAYFRLLDAEGLPITAAVQVSETGKEVDWPTLAWTGTEYGLAWTEFDSATSEYNLVFRVVDASGFPAGSPRFLTRSPNPPTGYQRPELEWNGEEFALVFLGWGTIQYDYLLFLRMDREGRPLSRPRRVIEHDNVEFAHFDYDGSGYGFVCTLAQIPHFVRLDRYGGRLFDPIALDIFGSTTWPRVMAAPWGYGVIYHVGSHSKWYYRKVTPEGSLAGNPQAIDPYIVKIPKMTWIGSESLIAITTFGSSIYKVQLARLDQNGIRITDDLIIHESPNPIGVPQIAWSGLEPAIIWPDETQSLGNPLLLFSKTGCCETTTPIGLITGLTYLDPQTLTWDDNGAERYDYIMGDLNALRSQGGDWANTVRYCESDIVGSTASDVFTPAQSWTNYQLVRGDGICGPGTYSSGGSGEIGDRDTGLGNTCP